MTNSATGNLEKALEELVQRAVENGLAPLRQEIARVSSAPTAPSPAPAPAASHGLSSLSQAVSSVLQPAGQTEIMSAALRGSTGFAPRCALLSRRGENFSLWRAEGFSSQETGALRSATISAAAPGVFKELCGSLQPICRPRSAGSLPAALEQALGAGSTICLLPVVVHGKVVAALFSDANLGSEEMSGLEILARVAGLSLETASRRAAGSDGPKSMPAETAPMQAEQHSEPALADIPMPEPVASETVSNGADGQLSGSFTASTPSSSAMPSSLPSLPEVDGLPDGDRDSHRKAHRFARVAVQDLLSYHKDKIAEGRKNRNLFLVLKDDIEKTRENYQKRFGSTAANAFDYLHYEMVVKLAENDPAVLGEQYPGPRA